jgi:NADPH:quinone reductase-like Zn-dependent oxidoreductase
MDTATTIETTPATPPVMPDRTRPREQTMNAVQLRRYGPAERLELVEVETPVPEDDQLVIRVVATSVNPVDWHRMRGEPWLVRATDGVRRPKDPRLGADVAGRVEAVGKDVTGLHVGDEVFGMSIGTFAEYVRVSREAVVPKPANVTFEQAAAVPVAATTALQGLRRVAGLQAGQRLLVNGASGGVGSFVVQLAKAWGAHVTAVTSTRNVDLARSIGADAVIDYTRDDFTRTGERYDVVFDAVGNRSVGDFRRVVAKTGTLVLCGAGSHKKIGPVGRIVQGVILTKVGSQRLVTFLAHRDQDDLQELAGLLEAGTIRPIIDRTYSFGEIREAIDYVEAGHARGKVVVSV